MLGQRDVAGGVDADDLGMESHRIAQQQGERPHPVEWWVVAAWSSLALVVLAGIGGAVGLG